MRSQRERKRERDVRVWGSRAYQSSFASVPAEHCHEALSTHISFTKKTRSTMSVYTHRMRVLAFSKPNWLANTSNQSRRCVGLSSSMKRQSSAKNETMYETYSTR